MAHSYSPSTPAVRWEAGMGESTEAYGPASLLSPAAYHRRQSQTAQKVRTDTRGHLLTSTHIDTNLHKHTPLTKKLKNNSLHITQYAIFL